MQVGATDSEDEADTAEDLQRIEAVAAAISQRMPQEPQALGVVTSEAVEVR